MGSSCTSLQIYRKHSVLYVEWHSVFVRSNTFWRQCLSTTVVQYLKGLELPAVVHQKYIFWRHFCCSQRISPNLNRANFWNFHNDLFHLIMIMFIILYKAFQILVSSLRTLLKSFTFDWSWNNMTVCCDFPLPRASIPKFPQSINELEVPISIMAHQWNFQECWRV